jgi:hypothetical protein
MPSSVAAGPRGGGIRTDGRTLEQTLGLELTVQNTTAVVQSGRKSYCQGSQLHYSEGMSRPSSRGQRSSSGQVPTPELLQGRAQTQLALGVLLVLVMAPTVSNWVRGDVQYLGSKLAGFAISALVLWQVYRGSRVALYITLGLSVLGGLTLMLLSPLGGFSVRSLILLLAGLAFAVCGLALYAHAPIKAFLEAQRRARQP